VFTNANLNAPEVSIWDAAINFHDADFRGIENEYVRHG